MQSSITKNRLFWILQISGWVVFYLIYQLLYYREYLGDLSRVASIVSSYISGFAVTLLLRELYKKFNYDIRSIPQILLIITIASFVFANIWFWVDIGLTHALGAYSTVLERLDVPRYISHIWSNTFVFVAWSSLYFGIKFWFDFQTQRTKTEQANALAQSAQLQMLRYQLNPHFLFNSLNSIRALVEEDKSRAKGMITELAEFLRYSLISKNYSDVPFKDELEAMKHYLAIEKTRYEENLEVHYEIDPSAENYPVLSFLIHPLIENALKYGMQTSPKPLQITISAKVKNNVFNVEICNTGKWLENGNKNNESTGTGLENVRRRLSNAFPERHKLIINKSDSKVCVIIEIDN